MVASFRYELVASFVNRSNLLKLWEKTETCEVSASGVYGPKNVAITRIPTPYAAMEYHHFSGCVPPFTHGVFNRAIRVHDANHDARPPRCNAHPVFFGSVKDSHMGQEGELLPDREVRRLVQDHSMTLSSPPPIP